MLKIHRKGPVEIGRKLKVHKTFRRRPRRLLNVLCTFNLRPASTGILVADESAKLYGLVGDVGASVRGFVGGVGWGGSITWRKLKIWRGLVWI